MNYKIKKYYRLFILALAIVIGIIFISVSVSAEEISDTFSSTNPSRQKSPEVLAADAEAMWRERLIQNGINPDQPLVNDSVAQLIQDGFVLQPLALYPPISGSNLGDADGVYAISNIGNTTAGTTFFMDTSAASYLPDRHMQQAAYTNTTPLTYFTVSSLFKLTQHPETGSYIIRLMTNNALSFDIVMNPTTNDFEVITKYIPLDDALVSKSDTYTITSTVNGGFLIRKYGTTRYVQTNESQGSGAAGAPGSYLSAADDYANTTAHSRWLFHLYSGIERNMLIFKGADTLEAGKTSILTPVFYSTRPGYNVLVYNFTFIPNDVYSIFAEMDGGIMYMHFYKDGYWGFEAYLSDGDYLLSPAVLNTNWYVKAPFDEGVYFISNVEYEDKYVQINNVDNMNAPNTIIELHTLNGYDHQRWQVEHYYDGYYKIISEYSGLELTAPTGYGNYVVTQTNESSNSTHLWKFIEQSDGTYKISPQSNSNYFMTAGNTSIFADQDLEIRTEQSDGSDKWNMTRMLPTSGAELTYDESLWNYSPVQGSTNCYAYAINDQVIVAGLDPGSYANPSSSLVGPTNLEIFGDLVSLKVQLDFQKYSRETGETYIFEEIEKYTTCPSGTYKVALIAGEINAEDNKWNYHWYRQDSDGLWSHKPGHTAISRYDADDKPIIDPETCEWDINYTYFVGFFAVTPWSNYA